MSLNLLTLEEQEWEKRWGTAWRDGELLNYRRKRKLRVLNVGQHCSKCGRLLKDAAMYETVIDGLAHFPKCP